MEEFLTSCRAVKVDPEQPGPGVHVVLGNEACDVDSMVCALTYAYFLSKTGESLVLPLMNIRQAELPLRSDNVFLLQQLDLNQDLLLFRDQLDLKTLHRHGRLRLTLVDHNVLPSSDSDLEGAVVEVIDHHLLEREPSPSCPVTVETVGSCATLVTERIIQKAPEVLNQQVAHLLYAAVVLDCVNMAPSAGKVTRKDSELVAALETRFVLPHRDDLFNSLHQAKFNVSGLSTEQMLLKDMKAVSGSLNVAISVLYLPVQDFLKGAELEAELSDFCLKFGYDFLLLMSISHDEKKEPIRELAVFSHSAACRHQVSVYLEQAQSPALSLRPISSPHPHITAYHQGNTVASRKKLLPLVKDFLKEQDAGCLGDGRLGDAADEEAESRFPPTPMNSLVDGCPLDAGPPPRLSARDLEEKISQMTSDP
ncbi:exopolyphosphatase PRUNE1 [Centropristis striata]|uniref:exopolyphosphatase PRUNE1 n=1 Tax=Centropristis striata TaxID=184440 RepID=UPI0027DFFFCD|nr:exopolyphosphatase PRUNE1 [Centropristis striata]